jgi:hypothetical protein
MDINPNAIPEEQTSGVVTPTPSLRNTLSAHISAIASDDEHVFPEGETGGFAACSGPA